MRLSSLIIVLSLFFIGCKKKKIEEEAPEVAFFQQGMIVLNEGLFQQNNSSLSWINLTSGDVNNTLFEQKTNRLLGDTGNDIQRYGNKLYVVVNVSSTIEVLNASTGSFIKQIQMVEAGVPKQPRYISFHNDKAYVSCFDGFVDVIDTSSLEIEERIQVGANPEAVVVSNNLLYVANSGGLNFPDVDSTVSVIDLSSHSEITKVKVGKNPGPMEVDDNGNIYVVARGNYSTIPSRLVKIDPTNNYSTFTFPYDCSEIAQMGNHMLFTSTANNETHLHRLNTVDETIQLDFIDVSNFTTLYKIHYLPSVNEIVLCEVNNYSVSGAINRYTETGQFITSHSVGLNPSQVVYYE